MTTMNDEQWARALLDSLEHYYIPFEGMARDDIQRIAAALQQARREAHAECWELHEEREKVIQQARREGMEEATQIVEGEYGQKIGENRYGNEYCDCPKRLGAEIRAALEEMKP
jgi:hypothetical protein